MRDALQSLDYKKYSAKVDQVFRGLFAIDERGATWLICNVGWPLRGQEQT
jgi:hypothetical protein